jgi:serine/threonine-protein kinase
MFRLTLAAVLACSVAARAAEPDKAALAAQARAVLKQYCHRCHGVEFKVEAFNVLDPKTYAAETTSGKPFITPGKPEESYAWVKAASTKAPMPPPEERERPSAAEKEVLRKWIEAGAPPFPAAAPRPFIGTAAALTAVRDHLRRAAPRDRRFLRYFTLTHLHNSSPEAVSDGELRLHRAAVSKAVNSLTWKPNIVLPEPVDKDQTVLAVDIRKLGWEEGDLWQKVLKEYPYGLTHAQSRDQELRQLDADIAQLSGCDLPYVRGDWFVATATRPPLYHTMLQLPKHAAELEKRLGVDVVKNFRANDLARAGFAKSGVSGQNRLVERHETALGSYWKSYDFKGRKVHSKLTRFPLGPAFPGNDFAGQAFAHDGGEIIFTLPNRMQAYLLVDGKDNRIDEGPTSVVSDALKTSGTAAIVSGASCMACHKHGMISCEDVVRTGTSVAGEALQKVELLYPRPDAFKQLLQADEERFVGALEKAVGPFLKVGDDRAKPIREFAEPVGDVTRAYLLAHLSLADVAAELGVQNVEQLRQQIKGSRKLRELGLATLAEGGVIKREEWDLLDGTSLFQDLAEELGLGGPILF